MRGDDAGDHPFLLEQALIERYRERLDFVDIVTRVETHLPLVRLAVERKIPVICQKPIAPDWYASALVVPATKAAPIAATAPARRTPRFMALA